MTAPAALAALAEHIQQAVQVPLAISGDSAMVTVSVRQLDDPALADSFAAILRDTGADPRRLLVEITGSVLMDDIGTGYSSLGPRQSSSWNCAATAAT